MAEESTRIVHGPTFKNLLDNVTKLKYCCVMCWMWALIFSSIMQLWIGLNITWKI